MQDGDNSVNVLIKNLPFSKGQTWKRKLEEKNNFHARALNWIVEEENDEFPELRNVMKSLEATKLTSRATAREM